MKKGLTERNRRQYQTEIIELYERQDTRPKAILKRYFKIPLIEKVQQNPTRQRQWIDSIQALNEKTAIQNNKKKTMTISPCMTIFFLLATRKGSDPIDALFRRGDKWYGIMLLIAVE